ncbi:nucleoside/nucleotide kinase family protein [Aureispira anguillae]|uniref:hypothetical protein n=1 Tax=Aureispira anguillae TaxID=2864201 RepID=UPI00222F42B5|nr:hypothetical protein [Aureispira anguillae]
MKAVHDLETDEYLDLPPTFISDTAILITDGAYLFKPIYKPHWDLKIYLKADFETARARGVDRDQFALGGKEQAEEKFIKRYHAASKLYQEACSPEQVADLLIDATNFNCYEILK